MKEERNPSRSAYGSGVIRGQWQCVLFADSLSITRYQIYEELSTEMTFGTNFLRVDENIPGRSMMLHRTGRLSEGHAPDL